MSDPYPVAILSEQDAIELGRLGAVVAQLNSILDANMNDKDRVRIQNMSDKVLARMESLIESKVEIHGLAFSANRHRTGNGRIAPARGRGRQERRA